MLTVTRLASSCFIPTEIESAVSGSIPGEETFRKKTELPRRIYGSPLIAEENKLSDLNLIDLLIKWSNWNRLKFLAIDFFCQIWANWSNEVFLVCLDLRTNSPKPMDSSRNLTHEIYLI